jgi:hypothetical protein
MSGPKVVRVVTREELVAEGQSVLRRLVSSVESWVKAAQETGVEKSGEVEQTRKRLEELEAMLRADKFQEFGVAANKEVEFLRADEATKLEAAARLRANARVRRESGMRSAQGLIALLRSNQEGAQAALIEQLEAVARGEISTEVSDDLLAKGFKSLTKSAVTGGLTEEQSALASRLGKHDETSTLAEWKAKQKSLDPRHDEANLLLAEIELRAPMAVVSDLRQRLASLSGKEADGEQSIRYDSLLFDLKGAKSDAIQRDGLLRDLKFLEEELSSHVGDDTSVLRELREAIPESTVQQLKHLLEKFEETLQTMKSEKASLARRRVMLDGLAALGYVANEGMATALVTSGRVVVRNPELPGYGVELIGGLGAERFQVRTVALSGHRDLTQDLPAETKWCGDFGRLQSEIQSMGGDVVIEKALPVGAVPLRVVDLGEERARTKSDRVATHMQKPGG